MNTQTQSNTFRKILSFMPYILFGIFSAACLFFGVVALFYGFVSVAAFRSAMIALILIGAGIVLIAIGLALIAGAISYGKKRKSPQKPDKTAVSQPKKFKDYFTLSNVSLVVLAVGALLVIVSAILGSIERDNWVRDASSFMRSHSYCEDIPQFQHVSYPVSATHAGEEDISVIDVSLFDKQAVIVYTDDPDKRGLVTVDLYARYERQISLSRSSSGKLTISETPPPAVEDAAGKIIFFAIDLLIRPSELEKQVVIYLPASYKDRIEIHGDHIVAKSASA